MDLKRIKLIELRWKQSLNQKEMANLLNVSTATYCKIENGEIRGSEKFWIEVQNKFSISNNDIWEMQITYLHK